MKIIIEESEIPITNMHNSILPESPLWTMKQLKVMLNMNEQTKLNANPIIFQEELQKDHTFS